MIKKLSKVIIIFTIILNLSGCSFNSYKGDSKNVSEQKSSQKVESSIKEESKQNKLIKQIPSMKKSLEKLCSDEFGGRLVGSQGNEKAGEYIASIFKDIGLEPLFNDSYYHKYTQEVFDFEKEPIGKKQITPNNLTGIIKGKDSTKAVVLSAHFDHLGYENNTIIRGALDNASGTVLLMDIAQKLKEKSINSQFDMDIIIAAFNGEESGLDGSKAFVEKVKPSYKNLYNINIDCVGGKQSGKITLFNDSTISKDLDNALTQILKNNNVEIASGEQRKSVSDNKSFEDAGISNVFIHQEKITQFIHRYEDTPDKIDYNQLKILSDALCDFIYTNDGVIFNK